jgi:hypothetical protein
MAHLLTLDEFADTFAINRTDIIDLVREDKVAYLALEDGLIFPWHVASESLARARPDLFDLQLIRRDGTDLR